ncbi:MAG: uroporphyrinogen decarboxylase [Mesorhizobium sp.]|nr:uroporphyrinogen decarboxylase [bacterium M00.F.Ca.ET.205.01.1.1]TGU54654.1 uroporphyrinogen decarboxylase [bacterium M00.F.Ca.ET.152.01.1.1]TGV38569.1 uroporphyrinogen decarboxylase [Mesorhizobium sp. M00.F.Ca.ET.186.01.1.1]TGZ44226.1 uroporphyrinogen decarboxylase [bacterium M00.F.Ca.ET.162.01.1.1]TJW32656.1 MAG: uroporphyrinogen decarboxylase [Mesorhizobium sp.]
MPTKRIILDVLKGEAHFPPPLWMMRQAGRYLPEYRETRRRAGSFLDLCYDPDLAVEVTLQPIERFGFDASILFSDILVVPHALGRDVRFEEGRGPLLTPISVSEILALESDMFHVNLEPVYETVRRLRVKLPEETTLIGFCGAPWTVATYMIAGHGTPDQAPARLFSYREPEAFRHLLKVLADHSAAYLIRQIEAGADAVQIFDSWSGVLDDVSFEQFCVQPVAEIIRQVRAVHPGVPIIGFPKGAGARYQSYREKTGISGLGIDWTVPLEAAKALQRDGAVQGNLDPLRLVAGGKALADGVEAILKTLGKGPLIFNLGHGITPETPIAHVEAMVKQVRSATR